MSARRRSSKFIEDETKNSMLKKKTCNEENFFKEMNANLKIKPV